MKNTIQHALITGATGGLGRCIATELADRGIQLTLLGRNTTLLSELARELPGKHLTAKIDLRNPEELNDLKTLLDHLPPIDLLINNAATMNFSHLDDLSHEDIQSLIETNLIAPINVTRMSLPYLSNNGAQILNIGSTFGSIGFPGFSTYCASKFGLKGFSEALRRELSERRIQVKYAAPRSTATSLNTPSINTMNQKLGNKVDDPALIARLLCKFIDSNNTTLYIGQPEKLFITINLMASRLVDKAIKSKLPIIKDSLKESI